SPTIPCSARPARLSAGSAASSTSSLPTPPPIARSSPTLSPRALLARPSHRQPSPARALAPARPPLTLLKSPSSRAGSRSATPTIPSPRTADARASDRLFREIAELADPIVEVFDRRLAELSRLRQFLTACDHQQSRLAEPAVHP